MNEDYLLNGERLDDLELDGRFIISHKDRYCFTSDAVMLANKVKASAGDRIIDLCTGGGIIALLIALKSNAKEIIGVEIQQEMADMARRSVEMNGLENRIKILNRDLIGSEIILGIGSNDIVVCNPPYYKLTQGITRENDCIAMARHEIAVNLEQIIETASKLLKYGGKFYLVHKSERLAEVISLAVTYKLQPKVLYNIQTNTNECDTFILVCKKNAKSGIKIYTIAHD